MDAITQHRAAPCQSDPAKEKICNYNREFPGKIQEKTCPAITVLCSRFIGTDPHPIGSATVKQILYEIQSDKYRKQIEQIRAVGDKDKQALLKRALPAVTFGCTLHYRGLRENPDNPKSGPDNLISTTGLFIGDIDHVQNRASVKQTMTADENILFVFDSPTDGLKVGLIIPGIGTPENYTAAFPAVERYFQEAYNLKIDPACKNLDRLCFLSWDQDLHINTDPIAFDVDAWLQPASQEQPPEPPQQDNTLHGKENFAQKVLEGSCLRIRQSPPGNQHITRLRQARLVGGYIASGLLDEAGAIIEIERAVKDSGAKNIRAAMKTVQDGIRYGKATLLEPPERWTGDQAKTQKEQARTNPAPDQGPEPLPDELLPVAPFDFALMPESLRPWAEDICDRMQCPPDFVAAGIMAALAGVIGRKVAIRPQARTDWTVICNLWSLIVGRPGVLKSPALEQALVPINRLAAIAADKHQEAEEAYQAEAMAVKLKKEAAEKQARKVLEKNPDADLSGLFAVSEVAVPQLKRYKTNDTTPPSLGELLRQNSNGLLVFRDEIVSLLKSLDREGQEEGRGFYLTAWNGDSSYTFDRIGRGLNLHIPAVCLSVLGGTQPGRLSEYIRHAVKGGAADDGLIQRFGLLVWPDTNGKWKDVDRWPDTDAKNQAFKVFDYLDKLNPLEIGAIQDTDQQGEPEGPPYLRFDAPALELFQEWRTRLEQRLRGELHPALESHFAKYRKLVPALALIIHLADYGTGPVSETACLKALAWSEYLETHAQRAYGSVSQPEISVAKALLRRIKKGDLPKSFSSRDVWRPGWAKLSDKDQVKDALRMLEDYNWIFREKIDATGGRPKTVYHLNERAKL
jgi:hypothetical protein